MHRVAIETPTPISTMTMQPDGHRTTDPNSLRFLSLLRDIFTLPRKQTLLIKISYLPAGAK